MIFEEGFAIIGASSKIGKEAFQMKRYWIIPALALLLTGCAGQNAPAASSAAGSDAVQSTPSRPAESATILDELPEGFEQVAAIGWCDFDRNGTEEEIPECSSVLCGSSIECERSCACKCVSYRSFALVECDPAV